jgi:broad specificity phosphatase PhoE
MKIFLLRHASPDWNCTDIPYDIPPGPPLSQKGEKEAVALAAFLKVQGMVKLYYSTFERSTRTAQVISALNGIACMEDKRLSEWREVDETETQVRERMSSIFGRVAKESAEIGPIGLVSHGGPVALLLRELGIDQDELAMYRKLFDGPNPLPPAGVWKAEQDAGDDSWNLKLEFTPKVGDHPASQLENEYEI